MTNWWQRYRPNKSTLPAAVLASLLCGAALIAIWSPPDSPTDQVRRFGENIAAALADSNAGRMLHQDKIELAVIANQIAGYPDVAGVAFYSAGNDILALSGSTDLHAHFTAQATLDDTVTGYVTVVVDEGRFQPPARPLAWLLSLLAVAMAPLVSLVIAQLTRRGNRSLPIVSVPAAAPAEPQTSFCLIVNLYNQLALSAADRDQALRDAMAMAAETCAVHQGLPVQLGERGVALLFDRNSVTGGQAICAAFLLMQLLSEYETSGEFRYFLTQARCPDSPAEMAVMSIADLAESIDLDQAMTIAALARPTTLLVTEEVQGSLAGPEALWCGAFTHPLLADLAPELGAMFLVTALPAEQLELVSSQADLILGFSRG